MNTITQYLNRNQRSMFWLCKHLNLPYQRFIKLGMLEDTELLDKLTVSEYRTLKPLIGGINELH